MRTYFVGRKNFSVMQNNVIKMIKNCKKASRFHVQDYPYAKDNKFSDHVTMIEKGTHNHLVYIIFSLNFCYYCFEFTRTTNSLCYLFSRGNPFCSEILDLEFCPRNNSENLRDGEIETFAVMSFTFFVSKMQQSSE